jgi:squalene synthase HpnC
MSLTWNFQEQLSVWGPQALQALRRPPNLRESRDYCAAVTRIHYENFTVASWLLPQSLRIHVQAIYAYCRWSDDLADETSGGAVALELLDWWEQEFRRIATGEPRHPVMIALRETIQQFTIPDTPFLDLLSAFRQDQVLHEYDTQAQLLDYCRRSADPVGRLVLYLFEEARPECLAPSDAVCTGLQLTNFWQDLARDRARGRVYLPREAQARHGLTPATWDTQPKALQACLREQVEEAAGWLTCGEALLPLLRRRRARIDVSLFIRGGQATLAAIRAQNYEVLRHRPTVSKSRKLGLFLRALLGL